MKPGVLAFVWVFAFACFVFGETGARYIAGAVFGKTFYFQNVETRPDTIGWPIPGMPVSSPAEEQVYRLKDPSALSLFILDRLGYKIFILSQWQCISRLSLKVDGKAMPDRYAKQGIMTDVFWEPVDRTERIQSETSKKTLIKIHFPEGGWVEMEEKEVPGSSPRQILGTTGLVLRYRNENRPAQPNEAQAQTIHGSFFRVYFISGADKKTKQIVSEIENEMDRLKLDLSYRIPEWSKADGPWSKRAGE